MTARLAWRERVAAQLLRWAPKASFSTSVGWLARRRLPRSLRPAVYGGFARAVGADLGVLDRPLDAFERFDDFFTRPLQPGARPIDPRAEVVSPVDGVVSEHGLAEGGRLIQAKGLDYTLAGLLADPEEARFFEGGAYVTIYLAPRDYHRIHAPVGGKVLGYRHIPGAFFPVNALSVRHVAGLFALNERLVTYFDSPVGRVALVKVAATGVGNITVAYDSSVRTHRRGAAGRRGAAASYVPARAIERGQELAMFHLGSTVVLLFEPGRVGLEVATGQKLRVGERMGGAPVTSRTGASA